jgi:hypothetical protein
MRTVARSVIALVLSAPALLRADSVQLKNGDEISGHVTAVGKKAYRLTTPYGRLLIPTDRIEKIVYDDGREDVFIKRPPTTASAELLHLAIVVTGDSFWQAWDPREAPSDPTLRLLLRVDGEPMAAYIDPQLDNDIAGAVVNTFAFEPTQTTRTLWQDTRAMPPEAKPGTVRLGLDLPAAKPGPHHLELVYQWNGGNKEAPDWRDLKSAALDVDMTAAAPTVVRLEQSRGEMSFGGSFHRARMRKVETFRIQAVLEPPAS